MSLFNKTWAQMTEEERRAFDARLAKAKVVIQAAGDAGKPRSTVEPLGPAYLRNGPPREQA